MAVSSALATFGQQQNINMKYPQTKKGETVDVYFNNKIADPYRWLEDDKSAETGAWVKAENEVTYNYLSQISFRDVIKQRMEKLWNYEKVGAPFKEGAYTYYYKNK